MDFKEFIKPELLILAVVCYLLGMALKRSSLSDRIIPFATGVFAIAMALIYVLATSDMATMKDWFMAVFVAITQGILCAGSATYINQLIKQGVTGDE